MRLAVLKIGGRLAANNRSSTGGVNETIEICKRLVKYDINVTFFTKVLESDGKIPGIDIIDLNKESFKTINKKNYDLLLMFNGNANFFGGVEDELSILNYMVINSYDGKVLYCLTDLNLILKQIDKVVVNKDWGSKYNVGDLKIVRDDIYLVSQAAENHEIYKKFIKNGINLKKDHIYHFPWEMFPTFSLDNYNKIFRSVDLIYGGTFRSGKREKDLIKYYFGYPEDIKVELFGNIRLNQFKNKDATNLCPPVFSKKLPYKEYIEKTSTGLSSVIIADPLYKMSGMRTTRFFECIRAGNIVFIDKEYYFNTEFFFDDNELLKDMCVVDSRDEVIDKIRYFKNNTKARNTFIDIQRSAIDFITEDYYYKKLLNILEEIRDG